MVDTNDKQRFTLQPGDSSTGPLIRANQGHSLQVGAKGQVGSQVGLQVMKRVPLLPIHTYSQVPELELMPLETPQALPLTLVHGTFWKHWPSILLKGLSRQGRTHIHLASGLPGDPGIISGQCHHHLGLLPGPHQASFMSGHHIALHGVLSLHPTRGPHSSSPCRHSSKLRSGGVHRWSPSPHR